MSDERCEPPEELRGVERIHWLENVAGGAPGIVLWEKLPFDDEWGWSLYGGGWHSPETAYQSGFRYFMLIPKPADLAAAKEREAALVGALRGAFAAVSASYDEAHAEWHHQDRRGEKANKIVREWRNLATALLDAITKEPTP
ncbi:MAG TPA: hypothetical protein VN702_17725 [Acetobacteraceae bacterium]|nr:hypothetical protein [Acetobacteraceae bacterium]